MTSEHRKLLRRNLAWWRDMIEFCEEQVAKNKTPHTHLFQYRIKQAEENIAKITIELMTGEVQ